MRALHIPHHPLSMAPPPPPSDEPEVVWKRALHIPHHPLSMAPPPPPDEPEVVWKRAQWLRAALLGICESMVATVCLMLGIGLTEKDVRTMAVSGAAGLIAAACTRAIGELVSVSSQYEIEVAKIEREERKRGRRADDLRNKLPSPWRAAGASALASAMGSLVPFLAAFFVKEYQPRVTAVMAAASAVLLGSGALIAKLGNTPMLKTATRTLLGGYLAIIIDYTILKLINNR